MPAYSRIRGSDAYLQAARDILRLNRTLFSSENIAAASCDITPDDRPNPNAGQLFIGLYKGAIRTEAPGSGFHYEQSSIVVAITLRTADRMTDRLGRTAISRERISAYTNYPLSIDEVSDIVINDLSEQASVLERANTIIYNVEGPTPYPCASPLRYESESSGGPTPVGVSHFCYQMSDDKKGNPDSGLLLKLNFVGGERLTPTGQNSLLHR